MGKMIGQDRRNKIDMNSYSNRGCTEQRKEYRKDRQDIVEQIKKIDRILQKIGLIKLDRKRVLIDRVRLSKINEQSRQREVRKKERKVELVKDRKGERG